MSPLAIGDPADLPIEAGSYALVIDILRPLGLKDGMLLEAGRYLYAGSARGAGGIRARCRRHLNVGKSVRWHVDRLTNAAGVLAIAGLPGGTECAIVDHLLDAHAARIPVPGFGSSDCSRCAAHLVAVGGDFDLTEAADGLAGAAGARCAVIWTCPPAACFWRPPQAPAPRAP